jgi:hypothetical protein
MLEKIISRQVRKKIEGKTYNFQGSEDSHAIFWVMTLCSSSEPVNVGSTLLLNVAM